MLFFYPVKIDKDLDRNNPLFVGNFFTLKNMWWSKRKQRQGLIISVAIAWYKLYKNNKMAPGFLHVETFLTHLTGQVADAKIILEHFFTIMKKGFNFKGNTKSPSIISPKKLNNEMIKAVELILDDVYFEPGLEPINGKLTQSQVQVIHANKRSVLSELRSKNREELVAPVTWLFNQTSPITFYFEPAGILQARDKSVWPIKSIELWPGWLRKQLFGTVVDLENAYLQFIINKLEEKYNNKSLMELKYPDLVKANNNKKEFREDICVNVLKLEPNEDNITVVKRLIMSLANGSRVSALTLTNGSSRTDAVKLIHTSCPHLLASELLYAGERLESITKQFSRAKRSLCFSLFGEPPSKKNKHKIFQEYFKWERVARYAIWEACGKTGLHLHDGIDGIITDKSESELIEYISQKTSLKIAVKVV